MDISASTLERRVIEDRRMHACRVRRGWFDREALIEAGFINGEPSGKEIQDLKARVAKLERVITTMGAVLAGGAS